MQLSNRQKPIEEVIQNPSTNENTRRLLSEIPKIKKFGESHGLTATKNYETYVALDQPFVSYIVTASHPLSFSPKTWSFPVVGSFSYLGWFKESDAHAMAEQLHKEGWDVDVRGATAYSTLGFFKDPILSSMLSSGYTALVEVVLHESVHATLYMEDQSAFNESLADFVAGELATEYLMKEGASFQSTNEVKTGPWVDSYLEGRKRSDQITAVFHQTYMQLEELYKSPSPDTEKQTRKMEMLEAMDGKLVENFRLRSRKGERYFWNNASLLQYRTYDVGTASFSWGFSAYCKKNWECFWKTLRELKSKDFPVSQMTDPSAVIDQIFRRKPL